MLDCCEACKTHYMRRLGRAILLQLLPAAYRPLITRQRTVIAASNDIDFQGLEEADGAPGSDYTAVFALAAFAAQYFNQFTVDISFLLKVQTQWHCLSASSTLDVSTPHLTSDMTHAARVGWQQHPGRIHSCMQAFAVFSLVNAAAAVVFNESAYDKVGGMHRLAARSSCS